MATFSFDSPNTINRSQLSLSGVGLINSSPRSGDLIYSSHANGTGIYSGGSSDRVGVTATVNNIPVFSNNSPALFSGVSTRGSNLNTSTTTAPPTSSGGSNGMTPTDWIGAILGIGQLGYNIFTNERNYADQQEAYRYNQQVNERVMSNQENAIVNQARQLGEIGLNPLALTGNGMSYSSPGNLDSPQHGSLDLVSTIKFMDSLKTSKAERDLIEAQATRQRTLNAAQSIVNEKNLAQLKKTLIDAGYSEVRAEKAVKEMERVVQLMTITDYDFEATQSGVGARYKDSPNEYLQLASALIGLMNHYFGDGEIIENVNEIVDGVNNAHPTVKTSKSGTDSFGKYFLSALRNRPWGL